MLKFLIIMNTNLKIVNFLDVTLNLNKLIFDLYKKNKTILPFSDTFLQATHPQSSSKFPNRLAARYTIILQTNKNKHIYDNALKKAIISKH